MILDTHLHGLAGTLATAVNFGVKPPKNLTDAVAALDAATAYAPAPPDYLSLTTVPAAKVPAALDALADQQVRRATVLAMRTDVLDTLGRHVLTQLRVAVPSIIEQLTDPFTNAAAEFTDAYRRLPARWEDPERIVSAGPDATAAFNAAATAARILDTLAELRNNLPGVEWGGGRVAVGLEYCDVTDTVVAEAVCEARGGVLGLWGEWLGIDGVERLVWRSSTDAWRAAVAGCPQMVLRHVRNGAGAVLTKLPA